MKLCCLQALFMPKQTSISLINMKKIDQSSWIATMVNGHIRISQVWVITNSRLNMSINHIMTLDTCTVFHIIVLTTTAIKWSLYLEAVKRHLTIYQIQERCSNQSRFKIMNPLKKYRKVRSQNQCLDRLLTPILSQSKRLNRSPWRKPRVNHWKNRLCLSKEKWRNSQPLSLQKNQKLLINRNSQK